MDIPNLKMSDGHSIPVFGLGTWQADRGVVGNAVRLAVDLGYRHFDCALVYGNEKEMGQALREKIRDGVVKREDLFITTKLWNTYHKPELVVAGCKKSLENLGLDYVDLYLMHWPFAFQENEQFMPRGPDGNVLFADYDYVDTWKQMEKCVELGLTKSIGLSNFNSVQVDRVVKAATIQPVMNQVECHPYLNQKKLTQFCKERGILITAYSPLGSGARSSAKPEDPVLLKDKQIGEIAQKMGKTPAQIILRYLVQSNVIPIPKSTNPGRLKENISIFDFKLCNDDMKTIDDLNMNLRYIQFVDAKSHKDYSFNIEY
ncbi:hypothetical protein RUM44_000674 [Polyplax serrata]|uniref:NADP-dependent oxidoreductase domain-containing protein n=1 Tax=Polyplax serrata TaxID=468196 RepID=A0ABR1B617_POLSC